MDYYSHKAYHQQYQRSSFDTKAESPRVQNRMVYDIGAATTASITTGRNAHRPPSGGSVRGGGDGGSDQLRGSSDGREMSSRNILDIKDVVRASFQKERSRSSVDGREGGLRESPRFGGVFVNGGDGAATAGSGSGSGSDRLWYNKDAPRYSVDSGRGNHQSRASIDSPRLSTRIKEAVRAAVEGRLDSVRASFDSKDSLRSSVSATSTSVAAPATSMVTSDRPRETPTPRSSSSDSRLLVELRESPRLSRDTPRYSWDGRDVPRSTPGAAAVDSISNGSSNGNFVISSSAASRESLRGVAPRPQESPRLSVDGRGGHFVPTSCHSVDESESPSSYVARDHYLSSEPSYYHDSRRFEIDMKDQQRQQQQSGGEPRKRVPSLVARLMGLEDLPGDVKQTLPLPPLQIATTAAPPSSNAPAAVAPPQVPLASGTKPSKESKLLKGLLQYKPRTDEARSGNEFRAGEGPKIYTSQEHLKDVLAYRQQEQAEKGAIPAVGASADVPYHQQQPSPSMWNGRREAPPKPIKLSPKHLGLETMPGALKHQQDVREMGALRQKVVEAMPKQLTEAVLTILKNADDNKKMPMSYADMESRLRQLRLRSSLQEHKTLRQILEAMQSKGLLNGGASRSKEGQQLTPDARYYHQHEARQQKDPSTYENQPPQQIMLPKSQEHNPDASKARTLRDLKKLGSKLHDQALSSATEGTVKPIRPQPGSQPQHQTQTQTQTQSTANQVAPRSLRTPDDQQQQQQQQQQQSASGASIVVMKPILKAAAKQTSKVRNPAMLIESMPSSRSPQGGSGGRASSWGSPVNRPRQQQQQQPGFGFGRESTGRANSDDAAAAAVAKLRRERILARAGVREGQSEHNVNRSPKLIALPQSTTKVSSSATSNDLSEGLRPLKLNSNAENRNGENGRKTVRSSASMRDESNKTASGIATRSQPNRDLAGTKKSAASSTDPEKLRRSNSEGRSSGERNRTLKSTGPAEVVILRNRSKRVSLMEPDSKIFATGGITGSKRVVANKPALGTGERAKDRTSAPMTAPSAERRTSKDNAAVEQQQYGVRKVGKQGGADDVQGHVRVTDGEALDHSNGRTPLVGLTNRLQSTEVALGELDREGQGQGARAPRTGILVKKDFPNSEEDTVVAELIDVSSELPQPSPVSVLDPASLYEEDVSPLALNKAVRGMQDDDRCEDRENDGDIVQQADARFQEWSQGIQLAKDPILVDDEASQHLLFLRESAKILPPQGEVKSIILHNQAEKVYVRDVLVVSGATMGMKAIHAGAGAGMIDPAVFDYLEEKQGSSEYGPEQKVEETRESEEKWDGEKERQLLDRRMLFDCVNEALSTLLVPYVHSEPWTQGLHAQPLRKKPTGQALVQQLWDELSSLPPQKPCENICESLYSVLQKDLVQPRNSWTDFADEVEGIGVEVEKMIFEDLVEETLLDVALQCEFAR